MAARGTQAATGSTFFRHGAPAETFWAGWCRKDFERFLASQPPRNGMAAFHDMRQQRATTDQAWLEAFHSGDRACMAALYEEQFDVIDRLVGGILSGGVHRFGVQPARAHRRRPDLRGLLVSVGPVDAAGVDFFVLPGSLDRSGTALPHNEEKSMSKMRSTLMLLILGTTLALPH
ncbi:MAG TPA: hypothetical protein VH374_13155 [Polyangia bacterium]|jgi:hypothetical protein|nr:hypothetical protein [Polyangia bacterium]